MRILMAEALPYFGPVQVGSHHYARLFMEAGHEVFWLGPPEHLLSTLRGALGRPAHREALGWFRQGPQRIGKNSWTYHPTTLLPPRDLPLLREPWVWRRSLDLCWPPVKEVLWGHDFLRPSHLWLSQCPHAVAVARLFPELPLSYRLSDRYADFEGIPLRSPAAGTGTDAASPDPMGNGPGPAR